MLLPTNPTAVWKGLHSYVFGYLQDLLFPLGTAKFPVSLWFLIALLIDCSIVRIMITMATRKAPWKASNHRHSHTVIRCGRRGSRIKHCHLSPIQCGIHWLWIFSSKKERWVKRRTGGVFNSNPTRRLRNNRRNLRWERRHRTVDNSSSELSTPWYQLCLFYSLTQSMTIINYLTHHISICKNAVLSTCGVDVTFAIVPIVVTGFVNKSFCSMIQPALKAILCIIARLCLADTPGAIASLSRLFQRNAQLRRLLVCLSLVAMVQSVHAGDTVTAN